MSRTNRIFFEVLGRGRSLAKFGAAVLLSLCLPSCQTNGFFSFSGYRDANGDMTKPVGIDEDLMAPIPDLDVPWPGDPSTSETFQSDMVAPSAADAERDPGHKTSGRTDSRVDTLIDAPDGADTTHPVGN